MPEKVQLTASMLIALGQLARRNGTQDAFIDLTTQWATEADAEIRRLRGLLPPYSDGAPPANGEITSRTQVDSTIRPLDCSGPRAEQSPAPQPVEDSTCPVCKSSPCIPYPFDKPTPTG